MPRKPKFSLTGIDRDLIRATRQALAAVRERIAMPPEEATLLDRAIAILDGVPATTDDDLIEISFDLGGGTDWHKGCDLTISGTSIEFNVGGYETGPYGSDSFTTFNYAIWAGAESEFDPSSDDPEVWIAHMAAIAKSPVRPTIEA